MDERSAIQRTVDLLSTGEVAGIVLKSGETIQVRRVTNVNQTAETTRIIPRQGRPLTVELIRIDEVHLR